MASTGWLSRWQTELHNRQQRSVWIIEESIPLRIAVQVLVSVGILATDVAAESWNSAWAIPLGALGAWWSWRHRYSRNWVLKGLLAVAMLAMLGVFFTRLFGNLNDTRLVLAELLVQLQVLHSFDIPRRQDLGYSMAIGLVLLGVSATLSQTLTFGPFLLVFLAVGLVSLMLDYRSRLRLPERTLAWATVGSAWQQSSRRLVPLGILTLVLGLGLFLLFPRFPGFQLTNFPVSGSLKLPEEFDQSQVLNPGLTRSGLQNSSDLSDEQLQSTLESAASGELGGEGGQVQLETYFGFGNQMDLRLLGRVAIRPRTVMRIRSQAASFWWVGAFDRFTGSAWENSRRDQAVTLQRNSLSNRVNLPNLDPISRLRQERVVQTYTIVSPLPSLVPTIQIPNFMFFPSGKLALDAEGGLRASAPLPDGLTYTVVSQVKRRDRKALQDADIVLDDDTRFYYLQLPTGLDPRIKTLAEKVTADVPSPYEKALRLGEYLKTSYEIRPRQLFDFGTPDLVGRFLFTTQGGTPEEFTSTYIVMLRTLGIPARMVVGYNPGRFNPFTGYYVVSNTDATSIAEIRMPSYGWFLMNPIPGYDLIPPSVNDSEPFSLVKTFWKWVAGFLPPPFLEWVNAALAWILGSIGAVVVFFSRLFQGLGMAQGAITLLLAALAVLLVGGIGGLIWWLRLHLRLQRLAVMDRLYTILLLKLDRQAHLAKQPAQTPMEFLQILSTKLSTAHYHLAEQIIQGYVQWRYGEQTPPPERIRQWQSQLRRFSPGQKW